MRFIGILLWDINMHIMGIISWDIYWDIQMGFGIMNGDFMAGWWFQPTPLKNDGVKVSWDVIPFPTEWKVIKFKISGYKWDINGILMKFNGLQLGFNGTFMGIPWGYYEESCWLCIFVYVFQTQVPIMWETQALWLQVAPKSREKIPTAHHSLHSPPDQWS